MTDPLEFPSPLPPTCRQCSEPNIDFCKHCGQEFCVVHQSRYNPKLCSNCVSDANMTLEVSHVVDEDGTEHKARQFKLIGEGWPNSVQLIRDLDDTELEVHINELTQRLKQAQLDLDYSKILHSAATFEKDRRQWSRARAARKRRELIEETKKAQGAIKLNAKSFRMKPEKDKAADLAKTLGISVEQATLLMKALAK